MMTVRRLLSLTVLALVGFLAFQLVDHLWGRYSQEAEAMGFTGAYERYLASQAGFPNNPQAYRASADAGGAPASTVGAQNDAFNE
jgi:hypothetical protein